MAKRAPVTERICLAPDCEQQWASRGLCWKHYNQALLYVKAGKTTWDALVAKGVARVAGGQGSPLSTAWLRDGPV